MFLLMLQGTTWQCLYTSEESCYPPDIPTSNHHRSVCKFIKRHSRVKDTHTHLAGAFLLPYANRIYALFYSENCMNTNTYIWSHNSGSHNDHNFQLHVFPPLPLSEAMEARARQRAERRKEIEELKRKKEEEKLVRDQGVVLCATTTLFLEDK